MFADDTNLFFTGKNIKTLFDTANIELQNIFHWIIYNELSLNVPETKYLFFHKPIIRSYSLSSSGTKCMK